MTLSSLPLRALVRAYQLVIVPGMSFLAPGLSQGCRFSPTCSEYAMEALSLHGAGRGSWLALKRVLRCHPWGGEGYDPVPGAKNHADACGCPHHSHELPH